MKKIIYIIAALLLSTSFNAVCAQNFNDGEALIPLTVVADGQSAIPASVQTALKAKLMQVVTSNGLGTDSFNPRFIITASVLEQSKDFIAGPPQQVSASFDITLYIADNFDRKIFSTVTIPSRAVDYSIEKALLKSIRQFNAKSAPVAGFVKEGRGRIIDYYNSQIDNIINRSNTLADARNYEEAMFLLTCVPEACSDAYNKALAAGLAIYKRYVDYVGARLLAQAKAAWAAQQNSEGAAKAGEYLAEIDPDASCRPQAEELYKEIKGKVLEDWHFEMKIYQDGVDLEKQRIDAFRAVGVAYGTHQPAKEISWLIR